MSRYGKAALLIGVLLAAVWAAGVEKNARIRIKVLDSETRSVAVGDQLPKNCDALNYDAYCHNSKTSQITYTLLVQEGDHPPFHISCNVDTKWSRCVPLEKGFSFDAKRDKHGLIVSYVDEQGKPRKQLYTYVDPQGEGAAVAGSSTPAASKPAAVQETPSTVQAAGNVKCSFTSTPSGAEVNVDGRYVGSTPSVVNLSVGNHAVSVSLPGFVSWKRDLTVQSGSELTVNAVLEKGQ